jgi:hypothetical protein
MLYWKLTWREKDRSKEFIYEDITINQARNGGIDEADNRDGENCSDSACVLKIVMPEFDDK